MRIWFYVLIITGLAVNAASAEPKLAAAPATIGDYRLLKGSKNAAGFIVAYGDLLFGVSAPDYFDDDDLTFENTPIALSHSNKGKAIAFDHKKMIWMNTVKVAPVGPNEGVQHLAYDPAFEIKAKEEVFILTPGGKITGQVKAASIPGTSYSSAEGTLSLDILIDRTFPMAGACGSPIFRKATGMVVGVLISADHPKEPLTISMQTLCLGRIDPKTGLPKPTIKSVLEPLVAQLPKGTGWSPRYEEVDPSDFSLVYMGLPNGEPQKLAKVTVEVASFAGMGGQSYDEIASVGILELSDAEVAKGLPARYAQAYKNNQPIFRLSGRLIDDLKIGEFASVKADSAILIRAKGKFEANGKPFSQTILRATRGKRMVEVSLTVLDLPDNQLAKLASDALNGADTLGQ